MTTTDLILNAAFVLLVLRQARERRFDFRSVLLPIAIVSYVAYLYVHTVPTGGNDLAFVAMLAALGVTLGVLSGLATHLRTTGDAVLVHVGWIAGGLLIAGVSSRMLFVFAVNHGAEPSVRAFSLAHGIGPAAWPIALVLMGLCEVAARLLVVMLRSRRLTAGRLAIAA